MFSVIIIITNKAFKLLYHLCFSINLGSGSAPNLNSWNEWPKRFTSYLDLWNKSKTNHLHLGQLFRDKKFELFSNITDYTWNHCSRRPWDIWSRGISTIWCKVVEQQFVHRQVGFFLKEKIPKTIDKEY